ncbi:tetratricopeptide repeat protein [bacterium BMS3Abin07]|nr:tetratricopeptide repeat protein [bacterium BMS3Abin07]HDZ87381.1 tetratricopeptide repeat protein [Nitrospirota bacterium]
MGKFLTFLFIVFIGALGYFALLNRDQVAIIVAQGHAYEIPKVALVLISSAIGALLMLFVFAVRDTRRFIFTVRMQKKAKKEDKIKNLYEKALDAYFAEEMDDSRVILEQVLNEDPDYIKAILKLGDIAYSRGDYKAAYEYYSRADSIDPDRIATLFALVKVKTAAGEYADALAYVDEILDDNEGNMRALNTKRNLLDSMDRWDDLVYLQKKIIKKKQTENEKEQEQKRLVGYQYEYGRHSLESGELEKAQKAFRAVLKLDGNFVPAHLGLAEVMYREENTEDAINYLENIYGQTLSLIVLARLEDLLIATGEPSRLIRIYKNSLADEPSNNTLKLFLGKLYHRLEMLDDAIEILEDVDSAAIYPEIAKIMGNIYLKRKQPEKAAEEFRKAVDMKTAFRMPYCCSNCGFFSVDWSGRCPSCKEWDTFRFDIFASCKFRKD